MPWKSTDPDKIKALDAQFGFLEDPDIGIETNAPLGLVGVKSNIRVSGHAWTAGIAARRDQIADTDAAIIARLRAEGAGFLPRLNMDEAALGASSWNPAFRMTDNPAAPGHSAGGSSGGSAAAVASGACEIALGTDTLGSVRIPAAYCGIVGLKTSRDALSMEGIFPLAPTLDTLGVLAASTEALQRMLNVLEVGKGREIRCVTVPSDLPAMSNEVKTALVKAQNALRAMGLEMSSAELPVDLASTRADAFIQTEIEAATALADETELSSGLQKLLNYGRSVPATEAKAIAERLSQAASAITHIVGDDSCLLMPTVAEPAFATGERPPVGQADFTGIANVAGLPAISVPMPAPGLPVAVQLIGPSASERALTGLARILTATGQTQDPALIS